MSRLDLVVILGVSIGATLWIEQRHRTIIETPTAAELAWRAAGAACPDREDAPYSDSCLNFLFGDGMAGERWGKPVGWVAP